MILTYLAHPVSPVGDETVASNLSAARGWYHVLSDRFRDRCFVADWILHCEAFSGAADDDKELRAVGMLRNFAQIERCHELWLVGPRVSRGMAAEAEYAEKRGVAVKNLTGSVVEVAINNVLTQYAKKVRWNE